MRYPVVLLSFVVACGHSNDPAKPGTGSAASPAHTTPSTVGTSPAGAGPAVVAKSPGTSAPAPAPARTDDPPPPDGHDFTATARTLLVVGACGDGALPEGFSQDLVTKHCEVIKKAQTDYHDSWVKPARAFFSEKVPGSLPKKVVYPFAGGDLSTALTVYPDADEITTMSLEPAGDPRTLEALNAPPAPPPGKAAKPVAPDKASATPDKPAPPKPNPALNKALGTIEYELKFLYRVNFSNTLNMIDAMRGGLLPTQLVFGLSALKVHGYEVVSLRYFSLDDAGAIHYLTDEEVAKAPDPAKGRPELRNRIFANAEIRFKKPNGRVQIYRHIQVNLDNDHLKKDPRVLKHLESKGPVSGMTKAASYLLSWDSFSLMRTYLINHVAWMVSDATGVAPKWGKPAGFEYETYGGFSAPHIEAGAGISQNWREEFSSQTKRELGFRFGYYDKNNVNHLVIMKKKS
jgi:hypothetical protein